MSRKIVAQCLGSVIAIVMMGCNPPPATAVVDSGPIADTGPVPQPVVSVTMGTIDLSCVGHVTIPAPTTTVTAPLHVAEFLSMSAITSNAIDIFSTDVITDTCVAPTCTRYMTDASGNATITLPDGGWFAYRVAASGQTAPVISYDQVWMGARTQPAYAFAPSTINEIGLLFNRTFQFSTSGSLSGRAVDCTGNALNSVRARIFVGDTEVVTGPLADQTSPRITGLEGTMPTRNALTGPSGNFVGANVPPSEDAHVEAWATLTAGALPQLIGCTQGRVLVGGITLAVVGPLRSDYPAGSRCAIAAAMH